MARGKTYGKPYIESLQTVLESIRDGELLFPDFQRDFVWKDKQRLQLFDSIIKGMPIGSLLIWRTTESLPYKKSLGSIQLPEAPRESQSGTRDYVLDGLQRLATLYASLMDKSNNEANQSDDGHWPVFYDLSTDPDEVKPVQFKLKSRGSPPPTWLPLNALFNDERLWKIQQDLFEKKYTAEGHKAKLIARRFSQYELAIIPMITSDLAIAARSFERINREGTRMGEAAMLRALTIKSFDLTERFATIVANLPWPSLDHSLLISTLKAIHGKSVYKADLRDLATVLESKEALEKLGHAVQVAVTFLHQRCGVKGEAALPYEYQLVALARAAHLGADLMQPKVIEALTNWFWMTSYAEYFTGLNDSQLARVFDDVFQMTQGKPTGLRFSTSEANSGPHPPTEALPPVVWPPEPLRRFVSTSTRSLLWMHRLAEQPLIDLRGHRLDGRALLARGSDTFIKLSLEQPADEPANRLLAAPEEALELREALSNNGLFMKDLRAGHLLPPLEDAASRTIAATLEWRRQRIWELELTLIKKLSVSDEPDVDDHQASLRTSIDERERAAARALGPHPGVDALLAWFFDFYKDPANGVPYDGRAGGYQYVFGGPWYAEEVLEETFPEVSTETLGMALEKIQAQSHTWVKSGLY